MPIEINDLESKRFGIVAARLKDARTALEAVDRAAAAAGVDMLTTRVEVDDLTRVHALEKAGFRLMDTLVYLGLTPVVTEGVCYELGVVISYALNRIWALGSANSHSYDLPRLFVAYGVGLASTLVTISVLLLWLRVEIAQRLNVIITAVVIYTTLRILRFGTGEKKHAG